MPPLGGMGSQNGDIRSHNRTCKLIIGYVRRGTVGSMFIRAGGWACPGCLDERLHAIACHLEAVVTTRALWLGELDDKQRRSASRQALRLPRAGRITASRYSAPALMLCEANLTPRTLALRPAPSRRAAQRWIDAVRDGPIVKRADWDQSWRPPAQSKASEAGVRAGMGPHDLWTQAVEAAGFRPGHPVPAGISDVEAAAAIEEQLEALRDGHVPGTDRWGRRTDTTTTTTVDNTQDVS